ncbi:MAG: RNA polymerase sigma factor [Fimbriimonadales bacterium]
MLDDLHSAHLEKEFEALWLACHEIAYRYAYRILGDPDMAQDVVQEASIRAWTAFSAGKFDPARTSHPDNPKQAFRVWFTRIVHNACLDTIKSSQRLAAISLQAIIGEDDSDRELSETIPAVEASPLEMTERQEFNRLIRQAVNGLPEPFRETFRLLLRGKTYEQIAEVQQLELGTVRSRIARARQHIRRFFEEHYPDYIQR